MYLLFPLAFVSLPVFPAHICQSDSQTCSDLSPHRADMFFLPCCLMLLLFWVFMPRFLCSSPSGGLICRGCSDVAERRANSSLNGRAGLEERLRQRWDEREGGSEWEASRGHVGGASERSVYIRNVPSSHVAQRKTVRSLSFPLYSHTWTLDWTLQGCSSPTQIIQILTYSHMHVDSF